jgi:hypothetical protein
MFEISTKKGSFIVFKKQSKEVVWCFPEMKPRWNYTSYTWSYHRFEQDIIIQSWKVDTLCVKSWRITHFYNSNKYVIKFIMNLNFQLIVECKRWEGRNMIVLWNYWVDFPQGPFKSNSFFCFSRIKCIFIHLAYFKLDFVKVWKCSKLIYCFQMLITFTNFKIFASYTLAIFLKSN